MTFLDKYNIKFNNISLLETALTHSSYSNENGGENYERLEYLGDAVLQIIMSEYFYLNTDWKEGKMSKVRASYVCEQALRIYSEDIGLIPFIKVGHGQEKDISDNIIADIFESTLGAVYLDQGIEKAKEIIYDIAIPYVKKNHVFLDDYKSLLQEYTQTTKNTLEYKVVDESGPAHDKRFVVEVRIDNMIFGKGKGKSKKENNGSDRHWRDSSGKKEGDRKKQSRTASSAGTRPLQEGDGI